MQMLAPDLLPAYHLGLGRDLVGSALRELTRISIMFDGRTIALRLRVASARFQDFVREHAYSVSVRKFTTKNLAFGKGYPEFRGKGYDTFVAIRWLVGELQANPAASQSFATLSTALWAADSCLSVATNASRYFTVDERRHVCTVGALFLRAYLHLARAAVDVRKRVYRLRPKYHMCVHLLTDDVPSGLNFTVNATWLDEDFNKVVMKVKKGVHRRTATTSTLKRWLQGLPGYFEHARSKES